MVLAAVVATGLAGLGWTARDLVGEPSASAPVVTQTSAGQTPVVVTDDIEPVAAVATSLSPAVVQIEEQEGLGSGVVYDASGLIVTNAHVVGDNSTVGVRFADGSRVEGQVLGADPEADIAVVQVDHPNLVAATLATTDAEVGQMAVALGSPFGLQQTVTAGIVSAVDRPVDGQSGVAVAMIQTDAPIN
ncbi:MAG: trypsin-like peptidase domain-containing protein, partial [Acidimicrobiales bacterium]|nr:trypsin-like peptidase domain-containing protein [Acidimicrobiales bacterium]